MAKRRIAELEAQMASIRPPAQRLVQQQCQRATSSPNASKTTTDGGNSTTTCVGWIATDGAPNVFASGTEATTTSSITSSRTATGSTAECRGNAV